MMVRFIVIFKYFFKSKFYINMSLVLIFNFEETASYCLTVFPHS